MNYLVRSEMYVTGNKRCTFNPKTMTAYSYSWWRFVEFIDGKVYFNAFHYSMPTRCHQRAVRQVLNQLGVKYETVSYQCGLQNLAGEINLMQDRIQTLQLLIIKPRTKRQKNKERRLQILLLKNEIELVKKLIKKQGKSQFNPKKLRNFPPKKVIVKRVPSVKETFHSYNPPASQPSVQFTRLQFVRGGM